MGKFTAIPEETFKQLQLNAGILIDTFDPETATFLDTNLLGATTGGLTISHKVTYKDMGDKVDNCPKNMKELMEVDETESMMSGTFVTITAKLGKLLFGAADMSGDKVTPRITLKPEDFSDIWWVGDYGDGEGFAAVHLINALSTGGFQLKTTKKDTGEFAFEFHGHYSSAAQTVVPIEFYVKAAPAA